MRMPLNIPNCLTFFRFLSIPLIIFLYQLDYFFWSFLLLASGLLTDFFDGYIARKLNQATDFGVIFDPIVDKMVSLSFYVYIWFLELLPWWFCLIIIIRNFSQLLSLPILIWWLKISFKVVPSKFAKWITAISDIFLFIPLFVLPQVSIQVSQLMPFMILFILCELVILLKYIPRLIEIASGKHDTFT